MAGNPTNGELAILIQSLGEKVDDGFKITHEKQEKTNGFVRENTEHRIKQSTVNKIMGAIVMGLILPVGILIFKSFL